MVHGVASGKGCAGVHVSPNRIEQTLRSLTDRMFCNYIKHILKRCNVAFKSSATVFVVRNMEMERFETIRCSPGACCNIITIDC